MHMSISNDLMKTGKWSKTQADLAEEFMFKCAYCGKDMLSSVDNHSDWQSDHIVPASRGGSDDIKNLALSCRTCNFIKGRWAPSTVSPVSDSEKKKLIEISKEFISKRRNEMQNDLELYKEILVKHG